MSVITIGVRSLVDGSGNHQTYDNPAYQIEDTHNHFDNRDEVKVDVNYENTQTDDVDDYEYSGCQKAVLSAQKAAYEFFAHHARAFRILMAAACVLGYFIYFAYAIYFRFGDEGSWRLLGFTVFAVLLIVGTKLYGAYQIEVDAWWGGTQSARGSQACNNLLVFIRWLLRIGLFVGVAVYVIVDVLVDRPENLIPVAGLAVYILIFYITSVNPAKVNWHTVFWGIALQYILALLILRTKWGSDIFIWMGDRVSEFLSYSSAGAEFVFGETYYEHFFAMKLLSTIVFFFTFISIMSFLGVVQVIVKVLGRFLAFCMGTTPAESIVTAANIFLSMADGPLLVKDFLDTMTRSELHAIMTAGFASIAGSVLGAYISFGVPANHLLSASVMSAPASLAISKLSYPEVERARASSEDYNRMRKSQDHNVVEAASAGATGSIKIIGAIAVNVLAFLSLLSFVNATLTWFGDRIGIEHLTFELICSYLLYPVPYFMGTDTFDCRKVAELIGVKTFTNEFIAYGQLQVLIQNRQALQNYTEFFNTTAWHWDVTSSRRNIILDLTGQVLEGGVLSVKSEVISTYALCGFSNFGSIGITVGALGALAPRKRKDVSETVLRAMICGNVACFLTACVAGLLYKDEI